MQGNFEFQTKDETVHSYFNQERHNTNSLVETKTKKQTTKEWRIPKSRTVTGILVMCLNIGVDPPDVVKPDPCAKLECWVDPEQVSENDVLDHIGTSLQRQYETLEPRARYKYHMDTPLSKMKEICKFPRRYAKRERILFHYNGHGVPKPTKNQEIWVFNQDYTQYVPLLLVELQSWVKEPCTYVFDCCSAGILAPCLGKNNTADNYREIAFFACQENEILPTNELMPADLFTSCLTTPIKTALRWHICSKISKNSFLSDLTVEILDKIPGKLTDRKTLLGELNWIFQSITDTIAWNVLPRKLFQQLYRQDQLTASLFRNFLLAERIMHSLNCNPFTIPEITVTYDNHLWDAWDHCVDIALIQLTEIIENPKLKYRSISFFSNQLTAFDVWLSSSRNINKNLMQKMMIQSTMTFGTNNKSNNIDNNNNSNSNNSNSNNNNNNNNNNNYSKSNNHSYNKSENENEYSFSQESNEFNNEQKSYTKKMKQKKKKIISLKDNEKKKISSLNNISIKKTNSSNKDLLINDNSSASSTSSNSSFSSMNWSNFEIEEMLKKTDLDSLSRGPEQLPVLIQVLLSPLHRKRSLNLLARFIDLGEAAIQTALTVGIFPYMLRLLKIPSQDFQTILSFIWAKILVWDPNCKYQLVRDNSFYYFIQILRSSNPSTSTSNTNKNKNSNKNFNTTSNSNFNSSSSSSSSGSSSGSSSSTSSDSFQLYLATLILSMIQDSHLIGKQICQINGIYELLIKNLKSEDYKVRQWSCLCLAKFWQDFNPSKIEAIEKNSHEKLFVLLNDNNPIVRACAVYALNTFLGGVNIKQVNDKYNLIKYDLESKNENKNENENEQEIQNKLKNVINGNENGNEKNENGNEKNGKENENEKNENENENENEKKKEKQMKNENEKKKTNGENELKLKQQKQKFEIEMKIALTLAGLTHDGSSLVRNELLVIFSKLIDLYQPNVKEIALLHIENAKIDQEQSMYSLSYYKTIFFYIWTKLNKFCFDPYPMIAKKAQKLIEQLYFNWGIELNELNFYSKELYTFSNIIKFNNSNSNSNSNININSNSNSNMEGLEIFDEFSSEDNLSKSLNEKNIELPQNINRKIFKKKKSSSSSISKSFTKNRTNSNLLLKKIGSPKNKIKTKERGRERGKVKEKRRGKGKRANKGNNKGKSTGKVKGKVKGKGKGKSKGKGKGTIKRKDKNVVSRIEKKLSKTQIQQLQYKSLNSILFNWCSDNFLKPMISSTSIHETQKLKNYYYHRKLIDRTKFSLAQYLSTQDCYKRQIDVPTGVLDNQTNNVDSIVFHPFEPIIITSDRQHNINVWNWEHENGKIIKKFRNITSNDEHNIYSKLTFLTLANEEGDASIITGSNNGIIRVWRNFLSKDQEPRLVTAWKAISNESSNNNSSSGSYSYSYSYNSGGGNSSSHSSHSIISNSLRRQRNFHLPMDWNQISGHIVVCSRNSRLIRIWDVERKKIVLTIPLKHEGRITSIKTDPLGDRTLYAGSDDGSLLIYDIRLDSKLKPAKVLKEHKDTVISVLKQKGGYHQLVSGSRDGKIKLWDTRSSNSVLTIASPKPEMSALALHDHGPFIATGSKHQYFCTFNLNGKKLSSISYYNTFMGQRLGPISALQFHPYRVVLAAGAESLISIFKQRENL
ncbi:regulatory-associated protein of mtor [Anaeramoeba flamelloides]|uniref:Regulatory-associated protein of mtor n=1 Tax=Anaeramoeba flamelloides TaxID=1746091 RepID=A0ABQ8XDG1_9EUKA|nr:regulatory-associated protein of mtor [Anaeramoeba flamelloides]